MSQILTPYFFSSHLGTPAPVFVYECPSLSTLLIPEAIPQVVMLRSVSLASFYVVAALADSEVQITVDHLPAECEVKSKVV